MPAGAVALELTTRLSAAPRRFEFVLIKPSHYDDHGYVIQWRRSSIPSNTLASLYGLAADVAARHVLGEDVDIEITSIDETNTKVDPVAIAARIRESGGFGVVGLVGVQSNQYPRALDIARPLREAGVAVVIGGFHVSGSLAMLPGVQPDLQRALDLGVSLYAGEAEGRLDEVLLDAAAGRLKPIYNYMDDLPGIEQTPVPFLPVDRLTRNIGHLSSFDAGRGCPYQCSFCTIINVQGRKSRRRSPDDVENILRENYKQGIRHFAITDDNFARNKDWEPILDRIIWLRENERMKCRFVVQVDTLCYKIPNFIEKCGRAGVTSAFIGLENINPENLLAAKKRQNKITEYRQMLLAWKAAKVMTYAGFIIGFPNDTPETVARDVEIIKRELPIDLLEFFYLTPLPGSEDHQKLFAKGVSLDPDLNKYDLNHVCCEHPRMSKAEWEGAYRAAWHAFYTPEHIATVMRRAAACGIKARKVMGLMLYFADCVRNEGVHPLEGGLFRRASRKDRRAGLPIESPLVFYPRRIGAFISKHAWVLTMLVRLGPLALRLERDPDRTTYRDLALEPVGDAEESRDLLNQNAAAREAVARQHRVYDLTHGRAPAPEGGVA
jgi:Radical SAM superfamily